MDFVSTVIGFSGFGVGFSIGLVVGYNLFIFFQPSDINGVHVVWVWVWTFGDGRGIEANKLEENWGKNQWPKSSRSASIDAIITASKPPSPPSTISWPKIRAHCLTGLRGIRLRSSLTKPFRWLRRRKFNRGGGVGRVLRRF
ncbi:hypothetical protein RHMOL_Rhmol07G0024800 [Rhododendron molle]|uniref:Uncharacterized protein n=1 Tax=Rhododendron molle TaxID=49168 RepID=A0ACC0MXB7_RHOML|nr:hypothetical protein RHMOL_Rhmol07G0024800 [Rhododendron molle]